MKEKIKKLFLGLKFLVIPVLIVLLLGNYFYTFSDFVAHTQTERRACSLINFFSEIETREEKVDAYDNLISSDKELLSGYWYYLSLQEKNCKSIQQFYIEQGFIILLGIIFIFRKKIIN